MEEAITTRGRADIKRCAHKLCTMGEDLLNVGPWQQTVFDDRKLLLPVTLVTVLSLRESELQ